MDSDAIQMQREYYKSNAEQYDSAHVARDDEHTFALRILVAMTHNYQVSSLLDVGAGTGRTIHFLREHAPALTTRVGVEPSEDLRKIGHSKGIPISELIEGDGYALPFSDASFDFVTSFGVLHHVEKPKNVLLEMLRVARVGVFISDSNNFGQGAALVRTVKQGLHFLGMWSLCNYIRTGGKGYQQSTGDGIFYSFSVFDLVKTLRKHCTAIHYFSTRDSGPNLYRSAPQLAIFATRSNHAVNLGRASENLK